MAERNIQIHAITFDDDGMSIQYIELPTDIRVGGKLVQTHVLTLSAAHRDYREDIELLHDRATKALRNALQDFEASEPHVPEPADTEDDDERGMGE